VSVRQASHNQTSAGTAFEGGARRDQGDVQKRSFADSSTPAPGFRCAGRRADRNLLGLFAPPIVGENARWSGGTLAIPFSRFTKRDLDAVAEAGGDAELVCVVRGGHNR
jgi:hypothetical protein